LEVIKKPRSKTMKKAVVKFYPKDQKAYEPKKQDIEVSETPAEVEIARIKKLLDDCADGSVNELFETLSAYLFYRDMERLHRHTAERLNKSLGQIYKNKIYRMSGQWKRTAKMSKDELETAVDEITKEMLDLTTTPITSLEKQEAALITRFKKLFDRVNPDMAFTEGEIRTFLPVFLVFNNLALIYRSIYG
jgi:hypothetical protein